MTIRVKVLEGGNCIRDEDDMLRVIKPGEVYPKTFETEDDIPTMLGPFEIISEKEAEKLENARKGREAEAAKEAKENDLNAKRAQKVQNGTVAQKADPVKDEPKPKAERAAPAAEGAAKDAG